MPWETAAFFFFETSLYNSKMEIVKNIEGKKYRYLKIGENGKRKLLLLWGFSSFKENVTGLVTKNFADYKVLVPEYPFHNGFDDAGVDVTSMAALADYLKPLLREEGFKEFDALGFSLGGLVLMELLKDLPGAKIGKVVIWASPVLGFEGMQLSKLLSQVYLRIPDNRIIGFQRNRLLQRVLLSKGIKLFHPTYFRKYLDLFKDYKLEHLGEGCAHLFIFDSRDMLIPIVNYKYIKDTFNSPEVTVEEVTGGGHFGTRQGWAKSLEIIKKFLEG